MKRTYEISLNEVISTKKTECYFAEIFQTISSFDIDKNTGQPKKKTLNINFVGFNTDQNVKESIADIELDLSQYFGQ